MPSWEFDTTPVRWSAPRRYSVTAPPLLSNRFNNALRQMNGTDATSGKSETDAVTKEADSQSFQPVGWHTVTPRIVARGAARLVEFIKSVFGAAGDYRPETPAELHIGDSIIVVGEAGVRNPMPSCLYVYVENADEIWQQAVGAGAHPLA
jgi:hypothetical protein